MRQALAKHSAEFARCCGNVALVALVYGVPVTTALIMWKH